VVSFILISFLTSGFSIQTYHTNRSDSHFSDSTISKIDVEEDLDSLMTAIQRIHPSPFHAIPKDRWISIKESIIEKAPLTYSTFYSQVLRLIALAKDGHTDAYPRKSATVRHALPAKFIVFPEGLYVVAASPKLNPLLGKKILKIEDIPTQTVLDKLRDIVPSDNEWGKQELLEDYIRMPALLKAVGVDNNQAGIQFTLKDDMESTTVQTAAAETAQGDLPVGPPRRPLPEGWIDIRSMKNVSLPDWQQNTGTFFWQKTLPEQDALYIQLNRALENESGDFAQFVSDLPDPQSSNLSRLVIDLRTNRGGDATLLQPLVHYIIKQWSYLKPGTIFVLTSNYTFSAAVHLAAKIEKNTHAIFVGAPTAAPPNHYADVKFATLPNSEIQVEISSLYWQKSDPRDKRQAIYPDIKAQLTWDDFIRGQDPALKTIANLDPENPVFDRGQRPLFNWFRDTQKKKE